ncbi:glycosyltransferase, partial [Anaerotruncus massiliensis (ex Liu et al. 2021)]|uniref:glycosyltransferase n=2 Tax=Oscillospiraceae TaxID=216572 RepID=UPI003AB7F053
MKILLVNRYHYPVGGTETYLFALDRMLREAGHQVRHFSAADPRNLPCGEAEFFARPLDPQKRPFDAARMLWNGEAARKLDALLARERPDVAHLNLVHHSLTLSILGPLARRKIPVVWTVHDLLPLCPNHLMLRAGKPCEDCLRGGYRACLLHRCVGGSVSKSLAGSFETWAARRLRLYDKVGCFIAPSECYRALLERAGFSRAPVLHLPNPLPPGTAFGYTPPEGDYILYCGRLSEEKGLFPLLEAAKRLGAPLVVAGEGPLKSALEAAAARGGS